MDWAGRNVLVTGAGGFIGSHLTERVVALGARTKAFVEYDSLGSWGWLDTSPVRREVDVRPGDVRDPETLAGAVRGVDTVFHLAALISIPYSYTAPMSYVRTNVEGTVNVLQAARTAEVGVVVHTSTSEVYGTAQTVPIDEEHPFQAQSPYAATKIAADKLVEAFSLSFRLPVVTLRPFNTFGPRQSERAIIPTIATQLLASSAVRLGNVAPTRDFTYVADTVDAFVRAADCPAAIGQTLNVGSGQEIGIEELAEKLAEVVGVELTILRDEERVRPERSEVQRLCANAARAREVLGWEPQTPLGEGLRQTVDWIRANLDRYRVGIHVA